jgi:hypothetical protein
MTGGDPAATAVKINNSVGKGTIRTYTRNQITEHCRETFKER